jgi:AraC family transcriptional regulator
MKPTTRSDYLDRIRRVLRFVQEHLDERLPPERLAGVANLSTFHFHRIFSIFTGESLASHVRRLRLERAAGALRRSDREVIDVALDAGYEAHEAFTRAFREHFGMPPSAYRKATEPIGFPLALCGVHYGPDDAVSRFVPLQEDSRMIDVRLETQPSRRLLALAHQGDYVAIGPTFGRLFQLAGQSGLVGAATLPIGIYYDDPDATATSDCRSHACIVVSDAVQEPPPGLELLTLAGGDYAVGVHRGSWGALRESYRWLFGSWLPSSGREPANAPCHEVYLNDPQSTPESDLVTHIYLPLAT